MARRKSINATGLSGTGTVDNQSVHRVFACFNPACRAFVTVPEAELQEQSIFGRDFPCAACGQRHDAGMLLRIAPDATPEDGEEYLRRFLESAVRSKHCRLCECLKPLDAFDRHARMASGRQMECKTCKWLINARLNPKRTRDQLREAAEGRRLLEVFRGLPKDKLDEMEVGERFGWKCFQCAAPLDPADRKAWHIDHVLPARCLWRLSDGAALLCKDCNLSKSDIWPSQYFPVDKLKDLSLRCGVPYEILESPVPRLNPAALQELRERMDEIYKELASRPREMRRLRALVRETEGIDVLDFLKDYERGMVEKALEDAGKIEYES